MICMASIIQLQSKAASKVEFLHCLSGGLSGGCSEYDCTGVTITRVMLIVARQKFCAIVLRHICCTCSDMHIHARHVYLQYNNTVICSSVWFISNILTLPFLFHPHCCFQICERSIILELMNSEGYTTIENINTSALSCKRVVQTACWYNILYNILYYIMLYATSSFSDRPPVVS